jgi:translation initiation factor eIF-2B subunit alpha
MGADGVVESGGIINDVGTYQLAMAARAFKRPFYVAVESYKFVRYFPLNQRDCPHAGTASRSIGAHLRRRNDGDDTPLNKQSVDDNASAVTTAVATETSTATDSSADDTDDALSSVPHFARSLIAASQLDVTHHVYDYTPPHFVTLLFTDLGTLTPSAVSDELIKLYF